MTGGRTINPSSQRLAASVAKSTSWSGVMADLGLYRSASMRKRLIAIATNYQIDTSHFTRGKAWAGGLDATDPRVAKRSSQGPG